MNLMSLWVCLSGMIYGLLLIVTFPLCADEVRSHTRAFSDNREMALTPSETNIWADGIGEGFRPGTQVLDISIGGTKGVIIFGGEERHDLALLSVSYGRMIGRVMGEAGSWYRGNWEVRGEVFGGAQINSETDGIVGITPHIRYNFATGTQFVPYLDAGAGVTLTEIREPDLGGAFQFNLQASVGVNYFIQDALAIHLEARYLHLSSADIYELNNGVNTVGVFMGVSTYF